MIIDNFDILERNKPKRFGPSRLEFWFVQWGWISLGSVAVLTAFLVLAILVVEWLS